MQRLEVSGAVRLIYGSLGVKGLKRVLDNVYWEAPYMGIAGKSSSLNTDGGDDDDDDVDRAGPNKIKTDRQNTFTHLTTTYCNLCYLYNSH